MTDKTLRDLQLAEIEIFKVFQTICEAHQLNYFIIGGTLIGAVRHGGFIPWDDDIDVAMPREDYEKFIRIFKEQHVQPIDIAYYKDNPSLYFYPVRLVNNQVQITDPRTNQPAPVWMDILPIDGLPNQAMHRKLFKLKMNSYRLALGLHYIDQLRDTKRDWKQRLAITFGKVTKIGKLFNPTKVKNRLDATLKSHSIEQCDVIGTCMGAYYFKEFVPKDYFGSGTTIEFEGMQVRAPEQVDAYLTHMYGDYMQLPPEHEQLAQHINVKTEIGEQ